MTERTAGAISREQSERRLGDWAKYLAVVAATGLTLLVAFIGFIASLDWGDRLPPPAIVNEVCADEKLKWLRDHPGLDPNMLIVGSSVAWRSVDSERLVAQDPAARPLNGGMCHASVNQASFVAQYLLRHFPGVRTVVAVVTPQDFISCARSPSELFDPETADRYAFDRRWAYGFYVRQFDPVSLLRNVGTVQGMRSGLNARDPLVMSSYGDGPINADSSNGLVYREINGYDPACFTSMHDLAESVTGSGRQLVVATSPLNPDWSKRYDPTGSLYAEFLARLAGALHDTPASFWNGAGTMDGDASVFTDAIHVNWPAARRYTAQLAQQIDADRAWP